MLRRAMMVVSACTMLFTAATFADESAQVCKEKPGTVVEGSLIEPSNDSRSADEIFWDFITCTHTVQECQWEASHHGFHHYRAVHDHFTCGGHQHYACYGGHH